MELVQNLAKGVLEKRFSRTRRAKTVIIMFGKLYNIFFLVQNKVHNTVEV